MGVVRAKALDHGGGMERSATALSSSASPGDLRGERRRHTCVEADPIRLYLNWSAYERQKVREGFAVNHRWKPSSLSESARKITKARKLKFNV